MLFSIQFRILKKGGKLGKWREHEKLITKEFPSGREASHYVGELQQEYYLKFQDELLEYRAVPLKPVDAT